MQVLMDLGRGVPRRATHLGHKRLINIEQMKAIYWTLVAAVALLVASCGKKETEGVSGVLEFKLQGEELMIVDLGTEFKDPGVKVMYWGEDKSSQVEVEGSVNTSEVGFYSLKYTFVNKDGLATHTSRDVIVADPSVKEDISGKYTVQAGSQREFRGTTTAFSTQVIAVKRLAPGFFEFSDLFAGYYEQHLKRNNPNQRMGGYVELKSDNTLVLHASYVPQWGDGLDYFGEATYMPETGGIVYTAKYVGGEMVFTVKLAKNS